jgi:hypothetical protein
VDVGEVTTNACVPSLQTSSIDAAMEMRMVNEGG